MNLIPAQGNLQLDGETIAKTGRSQTLALSGTGQQAHIETSARDLMIEVAHEGVGEFELVDPGGTTQDRIRSGEEGWAMVDPVGAWRLMCPQVCVGQAEVSLVGF